MRDALADAKDIKLRVRSLLKEDGIAETCEQGAWTKSWRTWLGEVQLPEYARWIIEQQLALHEVLVAKTDEAQEARQRDHRGHRQPLAAAAVPRGEANRAGSGDRVLKKNA